MIARSSPAMVTRLTVLLAAIALHGALWAQLPTGKSAAHTRADTLRGGIGPYRAWWNVLHYDVNVIPDFTTRSIQGRTIISFEAIADGRRMQIDLQRPLVLDSITTETTAFDGDAITVTGQRAASERDGHVIWLDLPQPMRAGEVNSVTVHYHGPPRVAKDPPWDGGWIWRMDAMGNPWMSVACQGIGASVWYPCKDHQSDEPEEGADLRIVVPDTLVGVGNGRLRSITSNGDGTTTWHWRATSPINTYNLVPYIGRYVHFGAVHNGLEGPLDLDHWVLAHNEVKARRHFGQVHGMLNCFEEWLGAYPFYQDGYKLVEAPHLGMEHQSAIAYGNRYMNGYLGRDLSGTGHGLAWDFIIVHESGHEWFGNSITTADIADMWVHEGFTQYSEALMVECLSGRDAANEYVQGLRRNIRNDRPMIGPYGVNKEGSGDMYPKGANLVHMVRQILGDSVFKGMLREMNRRFRHSIVTSAEIEAFVDGHTPMDLRPMFDLYLRDTRTPTLEWGRHKGRIHMRWSGVDADFHMPLAFTISGDGRMEQLGTTWDMTNERVGRKDRLRPDPNWYVHHKQTDGKALKKALAGQPRHTRSKDRPTGH